MEGTRNSIASRVVAGALLAAAFLAAGAVSMRAESFEGETALIKRLSPAEKITYFGLHYFLNRYQQRQYLMLETPEERSDWIDLYWIDHDPTPTTDINERRIEHEKRVAAARSLFGMKKAPGWDRRGETMIRWGLPRSRTRTWGNIGFYNFTPPGEIWYYISLDMIVNFEDYRLKGEYTYTENPYTYARSSREELARLQNVYSLYKYRVIQEMHPTDYMDFDEIKDLVDFNPDNIDYIADVDVRLEQPRDLHAIFQADQQIKASNRFYKYMKERPSIYSFELDRELLSVYFDITSFRGGPGKIRTEVNIEVPSEELEFIQRNDTISAAVELRVLVRDVDLNKVAYGGDMITAIQEGGEMFEGPSLMPGQVVLTLDPGYYRVGVEAMDRNSGRRGVYRTNLELPSFDGPLKMSDIQFASSIRETEEISKYMKGNLQVVPHPIRAYRIPFPLTFYFEIYGLDTDREGLAFYSVEYRIVPLEKRRRGPVLEDIASAISSSFETSGFGDKHIQRLEIATENLWEGPFELTVKVTDRRTRLSVEKSTKFSILD
jgi:GWxTD domain-containing protein